MGMAAGLVADCTETALSASGMGNGEYGETVGFCGFGDNSMELGICWDARKDGVSTITKEQAVRSIVIQRRNGRRDDDHSRKSMRLVHRRTARSSRRSRRSDQRG